MSRRSDRGDATDASADPLRPADALPSGADRGVADSDLRPSDHIEGADAAIGGPKLGFVGSLRFAWRQLTSMRTALFLLLLLAIAAVPGSLVPQRSSDPNGVSQYAQSNPDLFPIIDWFQGFDVYTSVWFSAIYLLLFVSLIGCVLPRANHHWKAMRAKPPRTPGRLERLEHFESRDTDGVDVEATLASAQRLLRSRRYRTARYGDSISAERGYLRETGNLVFHISLVGILAAVAVGGSLGYSGNKVVVEGEPFVNYIGGYDSFNRGRLVGDDSLVPYRIGLDELDVTYETENQNAVGAPLDYTAAVTVTEPDGSSRDATIKVNEPLREDGTDVYLLGNGYAPRVTVRDPDGNTVFSGSVPFLPQDSFLTSLGIIKVPDGLAEQIGMIGFFYPTPRQLDSGAFASSFPDLNDPLLTFSVYTGDLGLDEGVPKSVYELNTEGLDEVAGPNADVAGLQLREGDTVDLPNGLGTVSFDGVSRFGSLEIHHDPARTWVLVFAILVLAGLLTSLFIPRRRLWVKVVRRGDGSLELQYAGLARSDDPRLGEAVTDLADAHAGPRADPGADAGQHGSRGTT
ncbi:cytochrome c biogenesis protein ResB [Amnibacterium flavum]|uniref:Cytochrome C biogenesis protein n=1 Tax=Amnibacterium flavum TaxID=2173173 RepID=A0A2V1HSJ9_9MICO|nr:cytochrome c biogenesis protein ResB [Amnibacterium flavum]PVZ95596.1 cytochrome C biogenesis protein [Amnibacterium flavum]